MPSPQQTNARAFVQALDFKYVYTAVLVLEAFVQQLDDVTHFKWVAGDLGGTGLRNSLSSASVGSAMLASAARSCPLGELPG